MQKSYSGAGITTALEANISSGALAAQVSATTGWPNTTNGPFVITVARNTDTEEKILVDSYDGGGNLTIDSMGRGWDGTLAQSHNAGDAVQLVWDADSATDATQHIHNVTRDDHSQYVTDARHDVTIRHEYGAALGTPGAPTSIVGATTPNAGTGGPTEAPARASHQHAGIPTPLSNGLYLTSNTSDPNDVSWFQDPYAVIVNAGDLIVGGTGGVPQSLPAGAANSLMVINSGVPTWLGPGTAGEVLVSEAGVLTWVAPPQIMATAFTQHSVALNAFFPTTAGAVAAGLTITGLAGMYDVTFSIVVNNQGTGTEVCYGLIYLVQNPTGGPPPTAGIIQIYEFMLPSAALAQSQITVGGSQKFECAINDAIGLFYDNPNTAGYGAIMFASGGANDFNSVVATWLHN